MQQQKDKIVVFPIIIKKDDDGSDYPYLVKIPDLNGLTEAKNIADAIYMGRDYIGTYSLVKKLPQSNTVLPPTSKNEIATLVTVNISKYKRQNDDKAVKKTLSIPNYLNELGKKKKINFSQILTNALKQKLDI